jgi:hypothetical protein
MVVPPTVTHSLGEERVMRNRAQQQKSLFNPKVKRPDLAFVLRLLVS